MSQISGLVDHTVVGVLWMKAFQETIFIQGVDSIKTFMRGITILSHHLLLAVGNQEIMMKNMHTSGIREDMISHTLIHSKTLIDFVTQTSIVGLIHSKMLINSVMTIAVLTTIVMLMATVNMDMIDQAGFLDEIVVILVLMIMTIGIAFPGKAGRIAMREITIMVGITMTLTMREVRENQGMVVGEGVIPVIVNGIRDA